MNSRLFLFWFSVLAVSVLVMARPASAVGETYTVLVVTNHQRCDNQTTEYQTFDTPQEAMQAFVNSYPRTCWFEGINQYEETLTNPVLTSNTSMTWTSYIAPTAYHAGATTPGKVKTWVENPPASPSCPAAGTVAASGLFDIGTDYNHPQDGIISGCGANNCGTTISVLDPVSRRGKIAGVYHYYSVGVIVYDGETCVAGSTAAPSSIDPNAIQQSCAPDEVGIVSTSGVLNCYKDGSLSGASAPVATSTSTSTATIIDQETGASSVVQTTTLTETVGGNAGTLPGIEPDMQDYCSRFPSAEICKPPNEPEFTTPGGNPDVSQNWYSKRFPDGISGILNARTNELKSSPLGNMINGFSLTITEAASSGCFTIPGNLGIADFGDMSFCISQTVLNFIGIIMMLTAVFTSRSIIFGG